MYLLRILCHDLPYLCLVSGFCKAVWIVMFFKSGRTDTGSHVSQFRSLRNVTVNFLVKPVGLFQIFLYKL